MGEITMKRHGRTVAATAAAAALFACGQRPAARDDRGALDALRQEHMRGVNARDVGTVLAGMADDVVYLGPDLAPVTGRDSLGALLQAVYEQIQPEITITPVDLTIAGDWAAEWGCLGGRILPRGGGDPIPNSGKYLVVYRWSEDEGWRITRDIYNTGPCPGG